MTTTQQHGFTLIEVIIGFALLAVAMASATAGYIAIARLQQQGITLRLAQQNARTSFESVVREVRNANTVTVSPTGDVIDVTGELGKFGEYAEFKLDSSNRLVRSACTSVPPCTDSIISNNDIRVTTLKFQYIDPPGTVSPGVPLGTPTVRITMTFEQGDASITSPTDVYQRRFDLSTVVSPRTYQ